MKVCGLITEYNPLHKGHIIHIEKAKKITNADFLVAIMSGNFTQRGEVAIIDKYIRSRAAILCGVDLVIELPTIFATSSAGIFAKGALCILNSLNIIDDICFGSIFDDIENLYEISKIVLNENDTFKKKLNVFLKSGLNYPKARENAILEICPKIPKDSLKDANTILALEYINAIKIFNFNISPHTYKRKSKYTAKFFRQSLINQNDIKYLIPSDVLNLYNENIKEYMHVDDFAHMLQYRFLFDKFDNIYGMNDMLYNRIKNNLNNFTKISDFIKILKNKSLTNTHICRALIHTLLNITKDDKDIIYSLPNIKYIKILAFSKKGRILISEIAKKSNLKIITNPNKINLIDKIATRSFNIDLFANDIYESARACKYGYKKNEYKQNLFIAT